MDNPIGTPVFILCIIFLLIYSFTIRLDNPKTAEELMKMRDSIDLESPYRIEEKTQKDTIKLDTIPKR